MPPKFRAGQSLVRIRHCAGICSLALDQAAFERGQKPIKTCRCRHSTCDRLTWLSLPWPQWLNIGAGGGLGSVKSGAGDGRQGRPWGGLEDSPRRLTATMS
jgi:hypothetical protein